MKTTSFLQRRTPLKSYSHLTSKVSLKRGGTLKRSSFKKSVVPTSPQGILDTIFSQCIRRAAADFRGYVLCATCGTANHWRSMDCGHFQDRAHIATRYDPRNCAPQCHDCNRFAVLIDENGEHVSSKKQILDNFAEYIDHVHGQGVAAELQKLADTICHDFPYKEKITEWEGVLASLIAKSTNDINY